MSPQCYREVLVICDEIMRPDWTIDYLILKKKLSEAVK